MELEKIDIPYVQVPGGGIFAYINGDSTGKTVLLRSDIDALPILESETNLKNKKVCISKNPDVMHDCGHDGHIAMLLTAAKILKNMEASLNGRVVLMFEEGEEGHRNIEKLLAYMAEKDMKFDTCYASHAVSYTHLDVYKRQLQFLWVLKLFAIFLLRMLKLRLLLRLAELL